MAKMDREDHTLRKKSHISLAQYIVRNMEEQKLADHRKAFYLGSILPDCKPSFLSTKHEFNGTFLKVKQDIRALVENLELYENNQRAFMRHLGEVIHYLADYFTFPHNTIYPGNLKDHCVYEGEMKLYLRQYLLDGRARAEQKAPVKLASLEQLYAFIQKTHDEYLQMKHSIEEDCRYIVNLCYQVVTTIIELFTANCHQAALVQNDMLSGHLLGGTI